MRVYVLLYTACVCCMVVSYAVCVLWSVSMCEYCIFVCVCVCAFVYLYLCVCVTCMFV